MTVVRFCPGVTARRVVWLMSAYLPFVVSGCAAATAPPAYRLANQARLDSVAPWLQEYAADHPAKRQRVDDVLASWRIEVNAEAANKDGAGR